MQDNLWPLYRVGRAVPVASVHSDDDATNEWLGNIVAIGGGNVIFLFSCTPGDECGIPTWRSYRYMRICDRLRTRQYPLRRPSPQGVAAIVNMRNQGLDIEYFVSVKPDWGSYQLNTLGGIRRGGQKRASFEERPNYFSSPAHRGLQDGYGRRLVAR